MLVKEKAPAEPNHGIGVVSYQFFLDWSVPVVTHPFYFGIPLRSKRASNDWDLVCTNLQRTLRNLVNQTDQRFGIVLACHEIPSFFQSKTLADDAPLIRAKVHIISLKDIFPPPRDVSEFSRDKARKKRAMGAYLRSIGADDFYFMHFDADDLLRADFVGNVLCNDNRAGYLIANGYLLDMSTGELALSNSGKSPFYMHCGSCAAIHLENTDLPTSLNDTNCTFSLYKNHTQYEAVSRGRGKPLTRLDEYNAIYCVNHGDNNRIHRGKGDLKERYVKRRRTTNYLHLHAVRTRFPAAHWRRRSVGWRWSNLFRRIYGVNLTAEQN